MESTIDLRELGHRLASERFRVHLTERQVARFLRIDPGRLRSYESNGDVSITDLVRLADLYGCSIDYLLEGKECTRMPLSEALGPKSSARFIEVVALINGLTRSWEELEAILDGSAGEEE